jgi:hypothetical protein
MSGNDSDYDICKAFAEADDTILTAAIVEDMKYTARYAKDNLQLPKGENFQQLVIQSDIFVSMAKSNSDWFGRFRYVSISYESFDIILFSLPKRSNNKSRLFGIRVARPYDMTKLLEKMHVA